MYSQQRYVHKFTGGVVLCAKIAEASVTAASSVNQSWPCRNGCYTVVQVYQWLWDVCSTKLVSSPIKLGGCGVVVQIDKSLFWHKPKVMHACNLHHIYMHLFTYNALILLAWTFIIAVSSWESHKCWGVSFRHGWSITTAVGYIEIVRQRNATTLLPIIQQLTLPGTIIHSDEWSAYRRVQSLPNVAQHGPVNHLVTFVDPVTGVHMQQVGWETGN